MSRYKKILLGIMPQWTTLCPPTGIAVIKSYLETKGYIVKTLDLITKRDSLEFYFGYFDLLKKGVQEFNRGNFYNVGHDVMHNHLIAHLHYTNEKDYINLVKKIVYYTYYQHIDTNLVIEMNNFIQNYVTILEKYLTYLLEFEKPDILGLTIYKSNIALSLLFFKLTKKINPRIKTIAGGGAFTDTHCVNSPNFKSLIDVSNSYLDHVFIGRSEKLLQKYLDGELDEKNKVFFTRDYFETSIDNLTIPDYSDFSLINYAYLNATASISCKYQCKFCNEQQYYGKFQPRDVRETINEMKCLSEKYHRQLFFMTDACGNAVVDELTTEINKNNLPFYFDTYFRVDKESGDYKRTLNWRRGGLYRVRLGIESGSQSVLNKMRKALSVDMIKNALHNLAKAGIKTTTYWVVGFPGETENDFQSTLDLITEYQEYIYEAECNPFTYHHSGQNNSDSWAKYRMPIFDKNDRKMLIFDTWTLNLYPLREEAHYRMFRFVEHCKKLGIPNPYSGYDVFSADNRWKRLCENSVPNSTEFNQDKGFVIENHESNLILAKNKRSDEMEFSF